jgi:hypothetical protein
VSCGYRDLTARLRDCVGGPACLFAVARGDDFLLVVQERSSRVVNVAGRFAVVPKAFHQPMSGLEEPALSATVERELEQELLGRDDPEQISAESVRRAAPRHPRSLSEPLKWLLGHRQSYGLFCTGFGINMMSGNYEFACLIVIDDPPGGTTTAIG